MPRCAISSRHLPYYPDSATGIRPRIIAFIVPVRAGAAQHVFPRVLLLSAGIVAEAGFMNWIASQKVRKQSYESGAPSSSNVLLARCFCRQQPEKAMA